MAKKNKNNEDFPMWSIIDSSLDEQAAIIAETRKAIKEVEQNIIELEEEIEVLNNRINLYIRNVLNYPKYNNLNDLILIKDDFSAQIHPISIFHLKDDLTKYPEPKFSTQLTKNQATKILNFIKEYNHMAYYYEELVDTFNELLEYDDELMEDAINSLKETTLLHICDNELEEENIELFDDKKHDLIIVKEQENSNWCFKYIRKEDKENFNKSVKEIE